MANADDDDDDGDDDEAGGDFRCLNWRRFHGNHGDGAQRGERADDGDGKRRWGWRTPTVMANADNGEDNNGERRR